MMSLGGSLAQILMPLVCLVAFLIKTRDLFGASVALWWTAESFMDIAPYINDARAMDLMLLGGVTGKETDGHDWNNILTMLGWLEYDHRLAHLTYNLGILLMLASFAWGGLLLCEHYRMGSATAMPERLDGLVELVHQRKTGQYEPHTFRLLQREAHIFDKMLDEKSRFEVSLKNTWSEMVQGPAGCGSATDGVQHPLQIEPCLGAIEQTLADTDHRTGDHDLVTEFSLLPSAGPS